MTNRWISVFFSGCEEYQWGGVFITSSIIYILSINLLTLSMRRCAWDGNLTRVFVISHFHFTTPTQNVTEAISMKLAWHKPVRASLFLFIPNRKKNPPKALWGQPPPHARLPLPATCHYEKLLNCPLSKFHLVQWPLAKPRPHLGYCRYVCQAWAPPVMWTVKIAT